MKSILVAAALAVSAFAFGAPASAQGVNVQCQMVNGHPTNCRPVPTFRRPIRPPQIIAPVVLGGAPRYGVQPNGVQQNGVQSNGGQQSPCMAGYQFYPSKKECIEMHAPRFVEAAACRPGDTRQVPDPARPGGFRIQECRNRQQ